MNKLYLVRHGESLWNKNGRVQGQKDIILTENGKQQAIKLSKRLKQEKIDYIYTSSLKRAKHTAKFISKQLNVRLIIEDNLKERNFGVWEGLFIEDIKKNYEKEYELWKTHPYNFKIHKSETVEDVLIRVKLFLEYLNNNYMKKSILIVSHTVIIKLIIIEMLKLKITDYSKYHISNCSLSIIDHNNNNFYLKSVNDTSHFIK